MHSRAIVWGAALAGLLALAWVIAHRLPGPTWDEHFNGRYVRAIEWSTFGPRFHNEQRVSAGPGYFLFLRLFTDGRSLTIEQCRWFSLGFLLALLLLLDRWIAREDPRAKIGGWFFLGVPMLTAMAGYAMGDLMGLFLFVGALYQCVRAPTISLPRAVVAGLLFGVAALTRQVYLAGLLFPLWRWARHDSPRTPWVALGLVALLVPLPLFLAWKGVLPPFLSAWRPRLFSLPFLTLSFGETSLLLAFFCPAFVAFLRRRAAWLAVPTALGWATLDGWLPYSAKYVPLGWVVRAIFPGSFIPIGNAVLALTIFGGAGLLFFLVESFLRERDSARRGLLLVTAALLVAPAFHTVIYSVRYVLAPSVLLLLLFRKEIEPAKFLFARWSAAVLAGVAVLAWQTRAL